MSNHSADVPGGIAFVELIRLAIVILATAAALEISTALDLDGSPRVVVTGLGAGAGYVIGGILGRFAQTRITKTERSFQRVATSEIVAGGVGALVGIIMATGVTWPVLLFGGKTLTVPMAAIVIITLAWAGWRLGRARAGDLMVFLGAGGRLPSGSRAQGGGYKLVDTSVLIDGRIVDICRDGWVDGVLCVPAFVLLELQGLADSGEPERRRRGQRGLDTVAELQLLSSIAVEMLEDEPPCEEVDVKLLHVAKQRGTPLITTDGNLARVAQVQGIAVRNVHELADNLRPPVVPGDQLQVSVVKRGREPGQGVGFLADGTMVVIESASTAVGREVLAEVTSIMSNSHGRMLFATNVSSRSVPDTPQSSASRR